MSIWFIFMTMAIHKFKNINQVSGKIIASVYE